MTSHLSFRDGRGFHAAKTDKKFPFISDAIKAANEWWKDKSWIGFNIWDDYYDDGYVPEGEIQETHGYVEGEQLEQEKGEIAGLVANYIDDLDMTGVEVHFNGDDIDFKHLSHQRRYKLVEELENSGLEYKGNKINFYSES